MTHMLALLAALTVTPALADEHGWKAGFAKAPITPDQSMWMSGYASRTAPSEGKETDLWAKAAVLTDTTGRTLVLVTLDLVGIDRGLSQLIVEKIRAKHRLPREAVILSVSHTHCGPVVGTTLRSMYFLDAVQAKRVVDYTTSLPDRILAVVNEAVANQKLARLAWGTGQADFAVNRRENKEPAVPDLRAKGQLKGPVDHDVPVLAVRDADGKLLGIVFGYACHATVLSYQKWCGDYPGFAMMELEKTHPGAVAMFFAGCGADQNPLPRRSVELARGYGEKLADAVNAVLARSMTALAGPAQAMYREIDLPLGELPTREKLIQETMDKNKYVAARAQMLLKKLESGGDLPASYPYPVQTWKLGDGPTLVTLGGEVVVDYSLRLKKEHGAERTWVMGYANDVMAYIPSLRVLKEGGYEGATAMIYYGLPTVWGPRVEDVIVEEVSRQVKAGLDGKK
jgi:hypothetical protein